MSVWVRSLLKITGIFFSLLATVGVVAYITIIVLVPGKSIIVPNVVGKELREAVVFLSQNKLGTRVAGKKFSVAVPADIVVSQTPPPGTKVRANRSVELVISGGAEVLAAPNLVSMKLRDAKIYLSQLGINIVNVSHIYSENVQDEIIAQDPYEGGRMSREQGMNLLLSSGLAVEWLMMPDLRGEKVKQVLEWLEDASIDIAMIKEEPSLEETGTIIFQSPIPGSIVDENSRVELVVSANEETKTHILSSEKWILTSVRVPLGLEKRQVQVVIVDEEGKRELDYGLHSPGDKVGISCRVVGKGEIRIYVGSQLIKLKKVEG